MDVPDDLPHLLDELRFGAKTESAWSAAERFVHQGTRLPGAGSIAWALVDAIAARPECVALLGRPLLQLTQGDPWSKFPVLLSDEQLDWAESADEATRCAEAARAAASLCVPLLNDPRAAVRRAAKLLVFWERPELVLSSMPKSALSERAEMLEWLICRLFSHPEIESAYEPAKGDSLALSLSTRRPVSESDLIRAVREVVSGNLHGSLLWFDGQLAGPMLLAAKTLRNDLPRTVDRLLCESQDDPLVQQSVLALSLRLGQRMRWSEVDRAYFADLDVSKLSYGWCFQEVDRLRALALAG